jgi:Ser/Thr protein kinase RdoA (MazF antagonist)
VLVAQHVQAIVDTFGLGRAGGATTLEPAAKGRQGEIWRLETEAGAWAVKTTFDPTQESDVAEGAAFQEAAAAAGIWAPAVVRTRSGTVLAELDDLTVRVYSWAEMHDTDYTVDPGLVGALVAGLHRVEFDGSSGLDYWYTDPVGADRWTSLMSELESARAPFAAELAELQPELVALEGLLLDPSRRARDLRTCHRDLWADNVRGTPAGGLCVFDFENSGLADPTQELAAVLFEYCSFDTRRVRPLIDAYEAAGGPGRVTRPADFAMAIAQLGHILEMGCMCWLAAETDEDRDDNAAWVAEVTDRPLTRSLIEELLAG